MLPLFGERHAGLYCNFFPNLSLHIHFSVLILLVDQYSKTHQFRNRFFSTLHSLGSSAFNQIREVDGFKFPKGEDNEAGPALPALHPPHLLCSP